MKTEESNRLIAEFMEIHEIMQDGYSEYEAAEICQALDLPINPCIHFKSPLEILGEDDLRFHTSWDWLMPVVEKIDVMLADDNFVTIQMNRTLIEIPEHGLTIEGVGNTWIEATYKAVVEFIIWWYNQNK